MVRSCSMSDYIFRRSLLRWLPLLAFLIGCGPMGTSDASASPGDRLSQHVALISIDGLLPDYYLHPERLGAEVRTLKGLMASGSYTEAMIGILPSVTYPSHATLVTGMPPAGHGILTNSKPSGGPPRESSDIGAETIWRVAEEAGLVTASIVWPSTGGADIDFLIPMDLVRTPGTDIAEFIRQGSTPGLFESLETATNEVALSSQQSDLAPHLDLMAVAFATETILRHLPHLLLVRFMQVDDTQHLTGPGEPEVGEALERVDGYIGEILSAYRQAGIEEQTTFVIAGDHGFGRFDTVMNLWTMLAEVGWAEWDRDGVRSPLEIVSVFGSAAFYLKDPTDEALAERVDSELRVAIEARFPDLVHWISQEEVRRLGGFPGAAFVLSAAAGYAFTTNLDGTGELLRPGGNFKGTHGYTPTDPRMAAGLIASGAGVRNLGMIPRMQMIDVAPTVAALLGTSLPQAAGVAMESLLLRPQE